MPTISVTQEEYEAIMFYQGETEDKTEGSEDEQYLADHAKHYKALDKFRKKYHNAKNHEDARKLVKNALKIANKRK